MSVVFEVSVAKYDLLRDALLESRKNPKFEKDFHEYLRDSARYFVSMRNSICRAEAELLAVAHDGENVDAEQVQEAWYMFQRSVAQYEASPKSFD